MSHGVVKVGDAVQARVDTVRRHPIAVNHTLTHVLNWALRDVLVRSQPEGSAARMATLVQKGSFVNDEYLRFFFSWDSKLSDEDVAAIEARVAAVIAADAPVHSAEVAQAAALKIRALRTIPGETYGERVKVVAVGAPVEEILATPEDDKWYGYSVEFCGGTHIRSMAEARCACVMSEEASGKGVRKIVVYSGDDCDAARARGAALEAELAAMAAAADTPDARLAAAGAYQKRLDDADIPQLSKARARAALEAHIRDALARQKSAAKGAADAARHAGKAAGEAAAAGGAKYLVADLTGSGVTDRDALYAAVEGARGAAPTTPVLFLCHDGKKGTVLADVPAAAAFGGATAGNWVVAVCGKGGGKGTSAQGGLSDATPAAAAVEKATAFAASKCP